MVLQQSQMVVLKKMMMRTTLISLVQILRYVIQI